MKTNEQKLIDRQSALFAENDSLLNSGKQMTKVDLAKVDKNQAEIHLINEQLKQGDILNKTINATVIDFSTKLDGSRNKLLTRNVEPKTPRQLKELEEQNIKNAKKPVKKLGKKGDTFIMGRIEYKILERTDQFMFVEARSIEYNPNSLIPKVDSEGKRVYIKIYWQVGAIKIYQDNVIDAMGILTGELTERREHLNVNPNIGPTYDAKGMKIIDPGFETFKDKVYAQYLETIQKYEQGIKLGIEQAKAKEIEAAAISKRALKLAECNTAKYKAVSELKDLLFKCKDINSVLKDKAVNKFISDITAYDMFVKYIN